MKERKQRTVFVGNVPMSATAKQLQKVFRSCGKIEKIWFRSINIGDESKKPTRAKIITKDFGNFKDNKNAYVLYKEQSSAQDAKIRLNQVLFGDKHLRVDTCGLSLAEQDGEHKTITESGRNTCVNPWEDFTRTIFLGNLPFIVSEEELRAQFADCGDVENVRLIRDPKTHLGKGIGYVMFKTKEQMQDALKKKIDLKFKGREIRIARAVEPKRREKKQRRKAEALEERRARRREQIERENMPLPPKNFGDAFESEDSDDDKPKPHRPRVVRLEDTDFGKKSSSQADRDSRTELDLNNQHAVARRKKHSLL